MSIKVTNPVEILLWEIKFNNDYIVSMSFVVDTVNNKPQIYWSVASTGTNISPIQFFSDYDSALENLQKRCGVATLNGCVITNNEKYGEIRGFYNSDCAKQQVSINKKQTLVDDDKVKSKTKIIKRF